MLVLVVRPSARSTRIVNRGGRLEIHVGAAPRDGEANAAACAALAAALGLPKSAVTLVRGNRSREKTFAVAGLEREEAFRRLTLASGSLS